MTFSKDALILLATAGAFVLLILLIFFPIAEGNDQIFLALGSLMLGYYFGSSATGKKEPASSSPAPPSGPDTPAVA